MLSRVECSYDTHREGTRASRPVVVVLLLLLPLLLVVLLRVRMSRSAWWRAAAS